MFGLSAAGDSEVLRHHRRLLPAVCGVGQKSCECFLLHSVAFSPPLNPEGASDRERESTAIYWAHFVREDDLKSKQL